MEVLDVSKLFQPIDRYRIGDCFDRRGCDCFDRNPDHNVALSQRDRAKARLI